MPQGATFGGISWVGPAPSPGARYGGINIVEHGLWGGAFGAVLNPLGEAAFRWLGAGNSAPWPCKWKFPGLLDAAIPKARAGAVRRRL